MPAPTRDDIERAAQLVGDRVRVTPVMRVEADAFDLPEPVVLKLELFQHTGSFKPRGAFNRVLSSQVPRSGLVAASGGNHGLAVAHVADRLGVPATVFVPESSSPVKVARLREFGIDVVVTGAFYADAYAASAEHAERTGALVVHAYEGVETVAGQGLIGRELERQAPDLDTVLVAVGGGGLLGGIAGWYAGSARLVAVEPQSIPTLAAALDAGHPVDVDVSGVAADSLGARRVGDVGFAAAVAADVQSVLVSDDAILDARRRLWNRLRIAAEPGGAAALAALLSGAYRPGAGERVGVVVCGANTDVTTLAT